MKNLFYISLIALAGFLSSCATSMDATHNQNQLQTSVVLTQNNYQIVGTVRGESKQCYVLGIGGLSKHSLRESAMSDMMQKADLKGGAKAIINTNIQYKNQCYVFWGKKKAIAQGTIIEFIK